jgi:hypothetical protein
MKKNSSIQGAKLSSPRDSREALIAFVRNHGHENEQSGALKLKSAAQYLGGLSVPTMHRLIQRGLLRPNRSLRHLLFSIAELDRFLKDGMT